MTYAQTGAELLREVLATDQTLTCTSGTGIVPLCHAALTTWQGVEGRASSDLAVKSVRALAATMTAVIQAGAGASRWCETAVAAPAMADSFLRVFPATAVICLHRALPGVLAGALRAHPWGLGNSPFWAFASPHPGNNVATIVDYWLASAEQLLALEAVHPHRTLRVRFEDLAEHTDEVADVVGAFLGLNLGAIGTGSGPEIATSSHDDALAAEQLAKLPGQIRGKVGELHDTLGYPSPFLSGGSAVGDL